MYILCKLTPQMSTHLTLIVVHTRYEESTPRSDVMSPLVGAMKHHFAEKDD